MTKITEFEIEFSKLVRSGHERAVEELNNTPVDKLDIGNPNHPRFDGIFGYETKEFLSKQYPNPH